MESRSRTLDATIHLAFAFDVGYEIDLERARPLLAGESGPLARRRRTPESIRYRPAPLRVALDASGVALPPPGHPVEPPRADLSLFDFGAVSLAIRFAVRMTPDELLALAGELAEPTPLTASARLVLAPWLERIRPVVTEFEVSDLSEEYVIFQLGEATPDWLDDRRDWVAGLVRLETGPLSTEEVERGDPAGDLLRAERRDRHRLGRRRGRRPRLRRHAPGPRIRQRPAPGVPPHRRPARRPARGRLRRRSTPRPAAGSRSAAGASGGDPHDDAVRQVRELEIEATSLFERADNALKLIGDQYLVRIYDLASARFHLREWQQSIRRKLETVGDVYDLLVAQAGHRRAEFLELVIIVLIAFEIVLAFFRP